VAESDQKRQQSRAAQSEAVVAPEATEKSPAIEKGGNAPQAIEPFIKADAIAIGKWLVAQKLEALVTNPHALKASTAKAAGNPNPSTATNTTKTPNTASVTRSSAPTGTSQNQATPQTSPTRRLAAARAPLPPTASDRLTIDSALEMRVALVRNVASVSVSTSHGGSILSLEGQALTSLAPGRSYQAAINGGLTLNGEALPGAVWVQPDSGYVAVGDRWYRGRILLLLRENGIIAVNYVMLREYLYSVVGAEMSPSWSIEALKAQAIAARSYALVHNVRPASRDYDLDDTTRYQAYKGVMTEANTTQAAVQATAGEFISHNGGIVESLYAATQDIVNDAHRGFGMSQTGALDLARQGYQYHQILAYYYPQTAIGRLDIGE
jgi:stage II sporulation protein D